MRVALAPVRGCAAGSEAELGGEPHTPHSGSHAPSRTGSPAPESAKALAAAAGYGSCFGLASGGSEGELVVPPGGAVPRPPSVMEEVPEEELPPPPPLLPQGTTGIKNIGALAGLALLCHCRDGSGRA